MNTQQLRSLVSELFWPMAVIAVVASIALYLSPLLYHFLVEAFSIIVAALAMVTALISRRFLRNQYLLVVASALGWCAAIDLVHILTYEGMGLLPVNEQQVTLKLWIGARLLQAVALLAAAVWMGSYIATWRLQSIFALVTVGIIGLAFTDWLPAMYTPGVGLTPLKIALEWLVITLTALALFVFYRRRLSLPIGVQRYMPWAMVFMVLSEFMFTQYATLFGPANLAGHLLKVISYWFVYLGLVQTTLQEPFRALTSAAQVHDAVPEPALVLERDGTIRQANIAAGRALGVAPGVLVGKDVHTLFHNVDDRKDDCVICRAHQQGLPIDRLELSRRHGESLVRISARDVELGDDLASRLEVLHDITELHQTKRSSTELMRQHRHDLAVAKVGRMLIETLCRPAGELHIEINELLSSLPQAFQAPHLLKIHLQIPRLTIGAKPEHARPVMLRVDLETGAERLGLLEVFYEEAPRDISNVFTTNERALVIDVAHTIEALIRRSVR